LTLQGTNSGRFVPPPFETTWVSF